MERRTLISRLTVKAVAQLAIVTAALLLALPAAPAEAVTKAQLQAQINKLKVKVANLRSDVDVAAYCLGWYLPVSQYGDFQSYSDPGVEWTALDYDPDVAGAAVQMIVLADECRDPGESATRGSAATGSDGEPLFKPYVLDSPLAVRAR